MEWYRALKINQKPTQEIFQPRVHLWEEWLGDAPPNCIYLLTLDQSNISGDSKISDYPCSHLQSYFPVDNEGPYHHNHGKKPYRPNRRMLHGVKASSVWVARAAVYFIG